ncbi:MAG: hypothetical protein EOO77_43710 [Oxalobacteraceae bacterium]|nr:MAG: hypothetical protein EOO77_43710 [Oxalobacteraceae bacterium]
MGLVAAARLVLDRIHHRIRLHQIALDRQREQIDADNAAEEAAWAAHCANFRRFWEDRLKTGITLNLETDGRLALSGKSIKTIDNMAHRHTLRRDVYQWCQQTLDGKFEMVPFMFDQEREARIWFADPNDAFQFKFRWY